MSPTRIIIIRHAERPGKPPEPSSLGVAADGSPDPKSLTPRGWQRAGALARFFCPLHPPPGFGLVPSAVYAAGPNTDEDTNRPSQTVTPLVDLLTPLGVPFIVRFGKDDLEVVMEDVLTRSGVVLIAWEHHRIPDLAAELKPAPATPDEWPDERFDVLWVFDRTAGGWSFSQLPQCLLAGDSNRMIPTS